MQEEKTQNESYVNMPFPATDFPEEMQGIAALSNDELRIEKDKLRAETASMADPLAIIRGMISDLSLPQFRLERNRIAQETGTDLPTVNAVWREIENEKRRTSGGRAPKKSDTAIELIKQRVALYRIKGDAGAAQVIDGQEIGATFLISSSRFRLFVRKLVREEIGETLADSQAKETMEELESAAVFDGEHAEVFSRIGALDEGTIIVNPCWPSGDLILIRPGVWEVISSIDAVGLKTMSGDNLLTIPPAGSRPMVKPEKGKGHLSDLKQFIINDDDQFLLIMAFIVQCFFASGPFPILLILAECGSGKTFAVTCIKRLIDPHACLLLSPPREQRDVFAAAAGSWLLCFDNISSVENWLSDTLCRLSTGGGSMERLYYTNGEAYIFEAKRPIIMDGITDILRQSDALDRSIQIRFPRLEADQRKVERALWRDFNAVLPGIFSDLLDIISRVLAILPTIQIDEPLRMADFCTIGEATAQALGYESGLFLDIYRRNRGDANETVLEANPVATAVIEFIDSLLIPASQDVAEYADSAGALFSTLSTKQENLSNKYWPKTAHHFSGQLRRIARNLRDAGYTIEFEIEPTHEKKRIIRLQGRKNSARSVRKDKDLFLKETEDSEDEKCPF